VNIDWGAASCQFTAARRRTPKAESPKSKERRNPNSEKQDYRTSIRISAFGFGFIVVRGAQRSARPTLRLLLVLFGLAVTVGRSRRLVGLGLVYGRQGMNLGRLMVALWIVFRWIASMSLTRVRGSFRLGVR